MTTKKAVALAYRQTEGAPRVIGKGNDELAQRLIAEAKRHNVPVAESPELVAMLMRVNLDQEIPPALYGAVARLLHWAYQLKKTA